MNVTSLKGNGRVALRIVRDDSSFSMAWFNNWQYKVSVVSWTQYTSYAENT